MHPMRSVAVEAVIAASKGEAGRPSLWTRLLDWIARWLG